MQPSDASLAENSPGPALARRAPWFDRVVWLLGGIVWSLVIAWGAFEIERRGFRPAVLFPLAIGGLVGLGAAALARATRVGSRRLTLAAAGLGLIAALAQDVDGYIRWRADFFAVGGGDPRASALMSTLYADGPARFDRYLRAIVAERPVWWSLDVVLTVAGAALAAFLFSARSAALELSASSRER